MNFGLFKKKQNLAESLTGSLSGSLGGSRCSKCNYIMSGKQCDCTCLHSNKTSLINYTTLKTTQICTDCGAAMIDPPKPYNL